MPARWMWGWELGVDELTYSNTGWALGFAGRQDMAYADPFQPATGYGGGRYCMASGTQAFSANGSARTPSTGPNSLGTHSAFIFHDAYKRVGTTWSNSTDAFLQFFSGTSTEVVRLGHVSPNANVSAMILYVNGNPQGTTTTTYTGTQPYHRIVMDIDGINGNYDVYVDGVLEISVTGSSDTFASIDSVAFLPGANQNLSTGGGRHDHAVLFDSPADLALAMGDIFIQGLKPDADSVDGSWLNVGGVNDGTNVAMYANINDGGDLTVFIETTTSPDANEFDHEGRADIDPAWAPSSVHYAQSIQVARGSGAISAGRVTITQGSQPKTTSANKALVASGKMLNELVPWTGNFTTDLDALKTGFEV